MMLSDDGICTALSDRELIVDPLGNNAIQPASIDLRVSDTIRFRRPNSGMMPGYIDPEQDDTEVWETVTIDDGRSLVLPPLGFALVDTIERVQLAPTLAGEVTGKSSRARIGLAVEAAGFVDPGFCGSLTLELFNMTDRPILLRPGTFICQLTLFRLESPALRPYGSPSLRSRYQDQSGPTVARLRGVA